jgi:hypothetical protein
VTFPQSHSLRWLDGHDWESWLREQPTKTRDSLRTIIQYGATLPLLSYDSLIPGLLVRREEPGTHCDQEHL